MSTIFRMAAAAIVFLATAYLPASAEMTPAEKQEIEKIVRDYLLANPELIEEVAEALRAKREAEQAMATREAIEKSGDLIFDSGHQMVLGNPKGSITLVEFFDYNCGYCKRALTDMTALLAENPDLKIVMKEFPILSEGSVGAARVSVAVKDVAPESYLAFHTELLTRPGEATAAKAIEVAGDLGLDIEALKAAAAKPGVAQNIAEVQELASSLGISGTPSYVIGTELIPGAIGYDGLQEKVAALRACGATVC